MRVLRRSLTLIIYLVPLLTLVGFGVFFVRRFYQAAEADLTPILQNEASRLLKREVYIGKVTIQGGHAIIDDVRVAEGKTFAEKGALVEARQVILDFDLRKLLLEKDKTVPLIGTIRVLDPVGHLARDAQGQFNFADLLPREKTEPGRPTFGRLEIVNGTLRYEDDAIPKDKERPAQRLETRFTGLNGHAQYGADQRVEWVADAQETTGQVQHLHVIGSYDSTPRRLFLNIAADRLHLPLLNRFLPKDYGIAQGYGTGTGTVLYEPDSQGVPPMLFQTDIAVESGEVIAPQAREPVRNIRAHLTFSNTVNGGEGDAEFAGSRLHVALSALGTKNPVLHGEANGSGLQLQHILTALKLEDRVPALKPLTVQADVRARIAGTPDTLRVEASGPVGVRGSPVKGVDMPENGTLQVAFSGTLAKPQVVVTGNLPRVTYDRFEARNVALSAVYRGDQVGADFTALAAGGSVTGRVNVTPDGKKTAYRIEVEGRQLNLARVPMPPKVTKTLNLPKGGTLQGDTELDLTASGTLADTVPKLEARIRARDLRAGRYHLARAYLNLRTVGDNLLLRPLLLRDETGTLVLRGRTDLKRKTLALRLEADRLDMSRVAAMLPPAPTAKTNLSSLTGLIFLRNGSITGTWDDPRIGGQLQGYEIGVDRAKGVPLRLDYAATTLNGTRRRLSVENTQIFRFPAEIALNGDVRNPLAANAELSLDGSFQNLDIEELTELLATGEETGKKPLPFSGIARGPLAIRGTTRNPQVFSEQIVVENGTVHDYPFDRLTAALSYGAGEEGLLQLTDIDASALGAQLTGRARLDAQGRFAADARLIHLPLTLFQPALVAYALVKGEAGMELHATGSLENGKADNLKGTATLDTQGLTINGQDFGQLVGRIALAGDAIQAEELHLGEAENGIAFQQLRYHLNSEKFEARGTAAGIPMGLLQRALLQSPFLLNKTENTLLREVKSLSSPFGGTFNAAFEASGTRDDPTASLTWRTKKLLVEDQPVQTFTGAVRYAKGKTELTDAQLRADDTVVSAKGSFTPQENISAELEAHSIPLALLRRLLPNEPRLANLKGTTDYLYVDAAGKPEAPLVTVSLGVNDVRYADANLPGGEIHIEKIEIARATLGADPKRPTQKQGLNANELKVTVRERDNPALPNPNRPRYTITASGFVDFDWKNPAFTDETPFRLQVTVPRQGLGIVPTLAGAVPADLKGNIEGRFTAAGTLKEPKIEGSVLVDAERLQFASVNTALTGLRASLFFDGDRLRVDEFTARTDVGTRAKPIPGDPLILEGELPLREGIKTQKPLHLTGKRVLLAANPLPVVGSGRAYFEVASKQPNTPGIDLRVTGTLFKPDIRGEVHLRRSDFRLPDSYATPTQKGVGLPIQPTFNVEFFAEDEVRLSNAQLSATGRTEPGQPAVFKGMVEEGVFKPNLNGTLVIDKGTLAFPTARFAIQRGGKVTVRYPLYDTPQTADNESGLGINVDLTATTRLSATSVNNQRKRYTVTVDAHGPLNSNSQVKVTDPTDFIGNLNTQGLRLTFRSDPSDLALTSVGLQRKIIGLVAGESAIEGLLNGGGNVGTVLKTQAADIFSQSILPGLFERTGIGRALGFDEFDLDYSGRDNFSLRVSRQIVGPLYISYFRRFNGGTQDVTSADPANWEYKLSYRLRNNIQFSLTANDQRQNVFLVEGVFRF